MHKVGQSAHTPHGIGEIVEVDPGVRGSVSYKVAGRGFSVWIDGAKLQVASNPADRAHDSWASSKDKGMAEHEKHDLADTDDLHGRTNDLWGHMGAPEGGNPMEGWWGVHEAGLNDTIDPGRPYEVNKDNTTTLPYDYTPQHHVDMFAGEQTIQPGDYEIDPDERLHASDSLTGEQRKDNRPYPGPNPDLFAKSAAFEDSSPEWGDDEWHEGLPDGPERTFDARMHEDPMHPQYGVGSPGLAHPTQLEYDDPGNPDSIATLKRQEGTSYSPGEGRHFRPAGLSNRYAHILEADDHSEIGQFRADPVGYQQRLAHVMIAGDEDSLIEKFADYTNLLDSDEHMRTAAWKDVAAKAKRLRADGAVHPEDIGPNRIMATVDGDNATYRTLVLRGPGYAGIGKGANSATFSCTCSWGKWAFKRQFTFVGRMCSHALATLWELQSHTNKGNSGKFKSASVTDEFKKWADDNNDGHIDQGCIQDFLNTQDEDYTREDVNKLYDYVGEHHQQAPERDYDIPYTLDNEKAYKTSEILRTRPMSLTPDLREVPKNDEHEWTDVTEDDRKTTGPDQIVHFQASITAALHRHADGAGDLWNDVKDVGTGIGKGIGGVVNSPFDLGNAAADVVSAPVKGISNFIDQHNVQAHPDLVKDDAPAAAQQAGDYHMDQSGLGGIGKGAPGGPMSISDYLHPPAAANPAAAQHSQGTVPPPPPVGGPAAPGNPAATSQAPSADPKGTGTGVSTPNDPNGTPAIGQGSSYHVNQGDTLSDIAQRAGLGKDNYQQIADANKDLIKDPNHIETGWDIKIPGQSGSSSGPSTAAGGTAPIQSGSPADLKSDVSTAAGGTAPVAPGSPADPKAPDASTPPAGAPAGPPSLTNPGLTGGPLGTQGIDNKPFKPTISHRRYAESSDAALLDKLRQKSSEPASDDLGHMDERNDEIRGLVDELNDRGLDASFMVANLHYAENPQDGNPDFTGISAPGWADEPFQGSGPDPRHYISDSQSYLDDHEPDLHDVTEGDDIIKFNDSRSKPEQGPRHTSGVKPHGGPRHAPRIDPGVRGRRSELQHSAGTMPENQDTNSLGSLEEPDPLADSGGNDLVANFQRSAAAQDLWSGESSNSGGMFSDDAIAANAQSMLRTAGRKFTQQEQRELEEEAHILGARNIPTDDDLAGTHYLMGL